MVTPRMHLCRQASPDKCKVARFFMDHGMT